MSMRVTITQPNVYDSYGILMPSGSIKTVDSNFGASLVLSNRATDTDGVLSAPTNKPYDISLETPIYPILATRASIQAAINAVSAAGGGIVQLPSGTIPLDASLTMLSGVRLRGIAPQLIYNTIPDSGLTTLFQVGSTGGTVLAPTGAFPAITWNTTALAAPASQTAFSQTGLTNISIEDMGFLGGTHGILAGATNNASAWYSLFKNLYFTGQTVIGEALTNYQHCTFQSRYFFGCQWSALHQIDVASSSLAPGNSVYYDTYACNPAGSVSILTRGVTFITTATTGGAANNNEFYFNRMQSNRFGGTTTTQAATMANASPNITITDGTKFAVGLPVTVDATQNGFTLKKIYFVASVAANVITLANTYGGAAVNATGSTAVNIVHTGFPCFEMIALAGSSNSNVVMDNVDTEGFGTIGAFFQNCSGVNLQMSQVPSTGQATQSLCFRGCVNKIIIAPQSVNVDDDQSAVGSASSFYGARFGVSIGYLGMGISFDAVSGKSALSLGSPFDKPGGGLLTYDPSTLGGIVLPQNHGIGELDKFLNASGAIAQLNTNFTNTGASAAMTLSALVAGSQGGWFGYYNASATAHTITTAGELFNGIAGRTVVTINANASARFAAVFNTTNGTWTWVQMGGSSPMTAGVISAPS